MKGGHHDRLFRLAMSKYETAIRTTPDNYYMLNHYADILTDFGKLKAEAQEKCSEYFEKAFQKYKVAKNFGAILELGKLIENLNIWKDRKKLLHLAIDCYRETVNTDDMNFEAYRKF